ncbi:3-hydroxyacyl-ACP dehydratase FabZ [Mariniplasma anaerobium]|uniref:3-hydroxyacyl-[acyl-carrier-protein] dehydratase n=1 Tax=Mariniplasma anaerobium TaxID=2735436 RepID=A0A7U9TIV4_9MOLU|nr:3-hydroxyacyl-ACP dehydratase FabZ [Mariniplasma anaerobium]BCR36297.1 3-hydroxyacyl-[acyl-carrier-protein] dehydratase FabZ [Mariniplasma anaerobium]
MKLNLEEIKAIIPHRDPFLFLDEIIELDAQKATGIKHVTEEEFYFKGHFPKKPVVPGVILVESLAQVGAVILLSDEKYKGKIAYFTGIKNAKFRKSVVPGDLLYLHCEVTRIKGAFGFGSGKAYVNNDLVCEVDISFAIGQ